MEVEQSVSKTDVPKTPNFAENGKFLIVLVCVFLDVVYSENEWTVKIIVYL